jgi:hypothetical protein
VSTLHKWLDRELQGVPNDVLTEPHADIEYAADEGRTFTRWPIDAREKVSVKLIAGLPHDRGSTPAPAAADSEHRDPADEPASEPSKTDLWDR